MLTDAHQHFWRIGADYHIWPTPDLPSLYRDFALDEFESLARAEAVGGSILVQSQPHDRDTDALCAIASSSDFVRGVVGWVDLKARNAPTRIAELAGRPKLVGLRPMLQNLPDDWILDPALEPAIQAMLRHHLRFDALILPRHMPPLRAFARRYEDLPIVVDHAGKPPIMARALDPWRGDFAALALLPNVACKISGLLTEAGSDTEDASLAPYVAHALDVFGPSRAMWGSDWPVLNLAGTYAGWLQQARRLTRLLSNDESRQLFGGTAARFYGL